MAYRIHITSSGPRTGTTLLTEVLKNCYDIDCSCDHEATLAVSNSSFGKCNTVLTKAPSRTKRLQKILRFEKKLYVICLIRDPRDMIVSSHGKAPDRYYCGLNYWIDFLKGYDKLKNHKRIVFIRYEDFTSNPDKIQNFIESKIPVLNRVCKFSEYHLHANPDDNTTKALKGLRPIEGKGAGKWKKHLERVDQQIQKYGDITDSLVRFDYEKDSSWKQSLENVKETDLNLKSYIPENFVRTNNKRNNRAIFNFGMEKIGLNPEYIKNFLKPFLGKRINKKN